MDRGTCGDLACGTRAEPSVRAWQRVQQGLAKITRIRAHDAPAPRCCCRRSSTHLSEQRRGWRAARWHRLCAAWAQVRRAAGRDRMHAPQGSCSRRSSAVPAPPPYPAKPAPRTSAQQLAPGEAQRRAPAMTVLAGCAPQAAVRQHGAQRRHRAQQQDGQAAGVAHQHPGHQHQARIERLLSGVPRPRRRSCSRCCCSPAGDVPPAAAGCRRRLELRALALHLSADGTVHAVYHGRGTQQRPA